MNKLKQKYKFKRSLIKGTIKSRPNRFIMIVDVNGKLEKCHCPVTGKIGNINFNDSNIPCLLSKANNPNRKTRYTVEAIQMNRQIIGINETKVNRYIEFFLKNNQLNKIINVKELRREVKVNKSRIDFLVNNDSFVEVKSQMRFLPFGKKENKPSKFNSIERLIKQFKDISKETKEGNKSIILLCYQYDAKPFQPPKVSNSKQITNRIRDSLSDKAELWQVNLKIDKTGVSLIRYFRLRLLNS